MLSLAGNLNFVSAQRARPVKNVSHLVLLELLVLE